MTNRRSPFFTKSPSLKLTVSRYPPDARPKLYRLNRLKPGGVVVPEDDVFFIGFFTITSGSSLALLLFEESLQPAVINNTASADSVVMFSILILF